MLSRIVHSNITHLPGFFELWLRDTGTVLMGARAEESWLSARRQIRETGPESEGLSRRLGVSEQEEPESSAPSQFSLDGAVFDAIQAAPLFVQACMLAIRWMSGRACRVCCYRNRRSSRSS